MIQTLNDYVGISIHHDTITGTSPSGVINLEARTLTSKFL